MFAVNLYLELGHCPAKLWTNADFSPPKLRTNKDFAPPNYGTFILFPANSWNLHGTPQNQNAYILCLKINNISTNGTTF